jgi:hypothetical protein
MGSGAMMAPNYLPGASHPAALQPPGPDPFELGVAITPANFVIQSRRDLRVLDDQIGVAKPFVFATPLPIF